MPFYLFILVQYEWADAAPWLQISFARPEQTDWPRGALWHGGGLQRCHPGESGTSSCSSLSFCYFFMCVNMWFLIHPAFYFHFVSLQGILLDEASGVTRSQPVMPAGYQPPKIVVSSWNRKVSMFCFNSYSVLIMKRSDIWFSYKGVMMAFPRCHVCLCFL